MARPIYEIKEQYLGTGALADYTFDFKIGEADELLLIMLNAAGVEVARQRGNDTSVLVSSVDFDAENGGGTIHLLVPLVTDYTLIIYLANDAPTQPFEFRSKGSFTLRAFENALDWLAGGIQRNNWLAKRAIRINDIEEGSDFDPQLPAGLQSNRVIMVNPTGTGLVQGPTPQELAQASADASAVAAAVSTATGAAGTSTAAAATSTAQAAAAAASAVAALASQVAAAASAAIAAASAPVNTGPFSVTDGQAATNLAAETIDSVAFSSCIYFYEIIRGTTVFSTGSFSMHYRNGTWRMVLRDETFDNVTHGVTFSFTGTTVAQIKAALDVGAGNGTIKLKKLLFAA